MRILLFCLALLAGLQLGAQETKLHPAQIKSAGSTTGDVLTVDANGNPIFATPTGFSGAATDATLSGDGTGGSPLSVNAGGINASEINNDANFAADQTLGGDNKTVTLTGGGSVSKVVGKTQFFETPASGNTVTLTSVPDTNFMSYFEVYRGPVKQRVALSGTATDVTLSGSTLTFNFRPFDGTESVEVIYIAQ